MAVAPLLYPGNRMLNGLLHDFSLFGGQPDPAVTVRPASAPENSEAQSAHAVPTSRAPDTDRDALPQNTNHQTADHVGMDASVAVGSIHHSASADLATGTDTSASVHGASTAPDVLASLMPQSIGSAPDHAGNAPAVTNDTTATLVADQIGEGIIPILGPLTSDTLSLSSFAAHDIVRPVSGLLDGAGQLHDVVHTAGQQIGGIADGIADTVPGIAAPVGSVLDAATGYADHTIANGLGAFDGIGGHDPAGGIATLVGMVDTVDQFAVSGAAPAQMFDSTGSIVDDLIGGDGGAGLLGDAGHETNMGHLTHTDTPVDHVLGGL